MEEEGEEESVWRQGDIGTAFLEWWEEEEEEEEKWGEGEEVSQSAQFILKTFVSRSSLPPSCVYLALLKLLEKTNIED